MYDESAPEASIDTVTRGVNRRHRRRAQVASREKPFARQPRSIGFPALSQPAIPAGMMNTLEYPSFSAATAAVWQACQSSLAQ
jgi:hypothetical protein